MDQVELSAFQRIARAIEPGGVLVKASALAGGVSARVTLLEIEKPDGGTRRVVLRRHGQIDRERNPNVAADEFRLLRMLHSLGLPVACPVLLDESGGELGTPFLALEHIEGETVFTPAHVGETVAALARQLSRIHRIDVLRHELDFLPALDGPAPLVEPNPPVLLHGDFWPGNVLWKEARIVGVIDWEDAARGDPLADLSRSRLEMLWAYGVDAMERFTREYLRAARLEAPELAAWDLAAARRADARLSAWVSDPAREEEMRTRLTWFVTRALERASER